MSSFRFHLSTDTPGRETKLFIRVIHRRKYRDIRRDYTIHPDEWNPVDHNLEIPQNDSERKRELLRIKELMLEDLNFLENIVNRLNVEGKEFSAADIAREFREMKNHNTLNVYVVQLCRVLSGNERWRTARAYRSAVKSFMGFNGGKDIPLTEISSQVIRAYERYLLDNGLQMNTISFYMRNLRAIYYRAVASHIIPRQENNPFENVYTGVFETRRRALDQHDMKALAAIDKDLRNKDKKRRHALLYFMFAYHSRGMSFIDLAYLKKSDIKGDTLIYKRKKTGLYMEVNITKPMQSILDYFKSENKRSIYAFPILDHASTQNLRLRYETALKYQNKWLKSLASEAGLKKNLSTHVARHTWATLAKRMGYAVSLISEGLGHRDTKVTSIYLASFERSAMDEISKRLSAMINTV